MKRTGQILKTFQSVETNFRDTQSRFLLTQSQYWKHLGNTQNMLKVNNKDIKTGSFLSYRNQLTNLQ